MFIYFYYFLIFTLYFVLLPFIALLSFKKKYKISIFRRFFLYKNLKFNKSGIWFHSCSLGETIALKPIIEIFNEQNINISVITQTGYEAAKKYTADIRFLPFEIFLPFWIKKQKLLIVMEAELWLMLFYISKIKNIPTILLNARISDNSYKNYKKFSFFYKILFKYVDKIFAQSQIDKERLIALGAKNVEVVGNIKMFQKITVNNIYKKNPLYTITAASTHEEEEQLILDSYKNLDRCKLIIVPRHPERFKKVEKIVDDFCKKNNYTYSLISKDDTFSTNITIIDKMGLLNEVYAISDLVILGGSFVKVGGHNPLEPTHFKCKLVMGEHIFNQKSLISGLTNIHICKKDELLTTIKKAINLPSPEIKFTPDLNLLKIEIKKVLIDD